MFLLLLAIVAWLALGGSPNMADRATPTPARAPRTVTQADSGKTMRVGRSDGFTLELSHRWRWSEPRLRGGSVRLSRIDFIRDPGFDAWRIEPVRKGTTTITATGAPGKRFRLAVRVG